MDICRAVGLAVLGIRLLPSWASPPTDGIPLCCTFPLAPLSPSLAFNVPRRYASLLLQALPFQELLTLVLVHSIVFSGITRPLCPRSRAQLTFLARCRESLTLPLLNLVSGLTPLLHRYKPTYPQPCHCQSAQCTAPEELAPKTTRGLDAVVDLQDPRETIRAQSHSFGHD